MVCLRNICINTLHKGNDDDDDDDDDSKCEITSPRATSKRLDELTVTNLFKALELALHYTL